MKNQTNTFFTKIKSRPKTTVAVLIVLALLVYVLKGGKTATETTVVVRGDIVQQVAVTGKTVAVEDISIGFDKTGRVSRSLVRVGSNVQAGDTLVVLENADLSARVAEARANLLQEQIKLAQARQSGQSGYDDARTNMISKIRDAYVKSDNAVRNNIDQFFKSPRTSNASIEFSFKDGGTQYNYELDSSMRSSVNADRYKVEQLLVEWEASLSNLDSQTTDLTQVTRDTENKLNQVKKFLDDVAFLANTMKITDFKYEATIANYKSIISEARSNVSLATANIIGAREKLTSAPQKVSAGSATDFDTVLSQEARVEQFVAALASTQAEYAKSVITSPIDGIVTVQDGKVGETVVAGTKIVSIISNKNLEIEANVSEVNIGKLSVGNSVSITFDAFAGETFTGKVMYIEPAETIIDNVVNYKIKVSIDDDVPNIKSGLTANLTIKTNEKLGVLKVPLYTVTRSADKATVQKVATADAKPQTVEVTLGLSGNDGSVEILSGVNEGDRVLVVPQEK